MHQFFVIIKALDSAMGIHVMDVHPLLSEIEVAIANIALCRLGLINHLVASISNKTWSDKLGAVLPTVACLDRDGSKVDHNR